MTWAPIVHSRTAHLDFRSNFIVSPHDFTDRDLTWAKEYILATTTYPEQLRSGGVRWSIFSCKRYLVAGATCMSRELSEDCVHDQFGRPLFAFVGYVTKWPSTVLPLKHIDAFRPLYEFVRQRFDEQGQRHAEKRVVCGYDRVVEEILVGRSDMDRTINSEPGLLHVFPIELCDKLWVAAAYAQGSSVVLDVSMEPAWLKGPFTNIAVPGVESIQRRTWNKASPEEIAANPYANRETHVPSTSRIPHSDINVQSGQPRVLVDEHPLRRSVSGVVAFFRGAVSEFLRGSSRETKCKDQNMEDRHRSSD